MAPPGKDTLTKGMAMAISQGRQLWNRPGANQVRLVLAVVLAMFSFSWLGASMRETSAPLQVQVEMRKKPSQRTGAGGGATKGTPPSKQTVLCADYCAMANEQAAFASLNDDWLDQATDDDFVTDHAALFRNWDSLLDRKKLVEIIKHKKQKYIEQLYKDYGKEHFEKIFLVSDEDRKKYPSLLKDGTGRTFRPVIPGRSEAGKSVQMLRRKLKIKILSAQIAIKEHADIVSKCKCQARRNLQGSAGRRTLQSDSSGLYEKYVWATGGHSAAAGHGNLFNESYTAVMESHVRPVFEAIGINFEARKYAMGGTPSGPEMSMCFDQIYGNDVDIFSWDFGMMDGGNYEKLLQYGYRGATQPGRAALVGVCLDGGQAKTMDSLESMGMPIFYGEDGLCHQMREGIPESMGLSTDQLNALPDFVRMLKCDGGLETGDSCGEFKYTSEPCHERVGKASWHPGWKAHAMTGNGLALFLIDMLLGAAEELVENVIDDDELLLKVFEAEDEESYHSFLKAPLPDMHKTMYRYNNTDPEEGQPAKLDPVWLFKEPPICHTARLPARTRYLGYLTNTTQIGDAAPYGQETYVVGIDVDTATKTKSSNGEMRIAYIASDRNVCPVVPLSPDYKDVFFSGSLDGWTELTIPNAAEKEAYSYVMEDGKFQGIILVVFRGCDWGHCEDGFLKENDLTEKKFEMKVNGVPVTAMVPVYGDSLVLENENGVHFPPNSDGTYRIQVKVNEPSSFLKVSTFALF